MRSGESMNGGVLRDEMQSLELEKDLDPENKESGS